MASSELTLLLLTLAFFSSVSLGYLVAHRLPAAELKEGLLAVALLHLPLVPAVRALAGWVRPAGATKLLLVLVLGVCALGLASFYTVFLPRLIAQGKSSLAAAYTLEMTGALAGLLLVVTLPVAALAVLYQGVLLLMAWSLDTGPRFRGGLALASLVVLGTLPWMDRASSAYYYNQNSTYLRQAKVIFSRHSPYQKVEVLEETNGDRFLMLNGLEYFNSHQLENFNVVLTGLPARLLEPEKVLVVGGGSLSSVAHLHPYAEQITTVELDPVVLEAGQRFFARHNRLEGVDNWTVVVDDAKHYLANTKENYDLIIVDVPAYHSLQTALLFSTEFMALAAGRLTDKGYLSLYLGTHFRPQASNRQSGPVLAAVAENFPWYLVLNSSEADNGFVLAGPAPLPLNRVKQVLGSMGHYRVGLLTRDETLAEVRQQKPVSRKDLRVVWRLNQEMY